MYDRDIFTNVRDIFTYVRDNLSRTYVLILFYHVPYSGFVQKKPIPFQDIFVTIKEKQSSTLQN